MRPLAQQRALLRALQLVALAGTNAAQLARALLELDAVRSHLAAQKGALELALAALLPAATEHEFVACAQALHAAAAVQGGGDDVPSLLLRVFWLVHETTALVLEYLPTAQEQQQQQLPPCLAGSCDCSNTTATTTTRSRTACMLWRHMAKVLQEWPAQTPDEAVRCHRCACVVHQRCSALAGAAPSKVLAESLVVATLRRVREALPQDPAPRAAVLEQLGDIWRSCSASMHLIALLGLQPLE